MTDAPELSVIVATWNRGRHILPTLRSALAQDFRDFELIVVGDNCTDDTERVVAPLLSERVRWINLPERGGSQSFPNNAGIAAARGRYVAYLGHDDIWARDHLARLREAFASSPECSFAVSGCLYHGPEGSDRYFVTGLIGSDADKFVHFFPPSALAHRRSVVEEIGPWRKPDEIRPPVDAEFALRAAHAGLRFCGTGCVTAHKLAAGHRYLSYLEQGSAEQEDILRRFGARDFEAWLAHCIERSRARGLYMSLRHPDYSKRPDGSFAVHNRAVKGLTPPPLQTLVERTIIPQANDPRALDWYPLQSVGQRRLRWSGPSPSPRLLIPFTSSQRVRLSLEIHAAAPGCLEQLAVSVNGRPVPWRLVERAGLPRLLVLDCRLRRDACSRIAFKAPTSTEGDQLGRKPGQDAGFAAGDMTLEPLPSVGKRVLVWCLATAAQRSRLAPWRPRAAPSSLDERALHVAGGSRRS
jgi:glycosyltransferase involved in cell wall biosynthesis